MRTTALRRTALASSVVLTTTLLLAACGGSDDASGGSMAEDSETTRSQSDEMSNDGMSDEEMSEEEMSDDEMSDDMSEDMAAQSGEFEGLNDKAVSGTAELSDSELVLSDFSSDEGPDLHVYLTNGTDEAAVEAGTELDVVAFDEASQTFALDGVDVADYDTVVIHCDKAKAVFGAAELA